MSELWITGYGIVSAIGVGKEQTQASLLASKSGIGKICYLKTEHTEFPVGEVKLSNEAMADRLHIAPDTPTTRTSLMGMLALQEALLHAHIDAPTLKKTALVSGTTVGGMDKSEQFYLDFLDGNSHNEYIKTHDCGACTEMMADHFGSFLSVTTLSTACSSAANAMIYGAQLLESGNAEIAVVGGSECITKFHLNGFATLRILDEQPCRPFDASRAGLNLGEGAAFLVLETPDHARSRGVRPHAILAGYGNACDAFHQTASSPDGEGAFRAMKEALRKGGITPDAVDYINAHGTGTPNNDSSESQAMRRLFGETVPPLSSTKSFTGHTTSASGSIEAVICILALQNRFIPANLNFRQASDCLAPVGSILNDHDLRFVLCNSFGFGGNDSSLLLAHPEAMRPAYRPTPAGHTPVYVYAAQQISIQQPLSRQWMDTPLLHTAPYNRAIEADYKAYIPPLEARRMGPLLKRALATSKVALAQSGVDMPDAIITGTGLGCIENTERFLDALCREGEQLLKPTHFMQSTHNTISSLMAIHLHCHGYNATYAHKNISFDSALSDAFLQLQQQQIHSAMVGGFDEMTPSYFSLLEKAGYLGLEGEIAGESSTSLIIGHEGVSSHAPLCRLCDIAMLYRPTPQQAQALVLSMLNAHGLTLSHIAGVITGVNGSEESQRHYDADYSQIFGSLPMLRYKHLFGESYTASGLAIYAAACCLAEGRIPASMAMGKENPPTAKEVKALLVFNKDDNKNYSFTLLSR